MQRGKHRVRERERESIPFSIPGRRRRSAETICLASKISLAISRDNENRFPFFRRPIFLTNSLRDQTLPSPVCARVITRSN